MVRAKKEDAPAKPADASKAGGNGGKQVTAAEFKKMYVAGTVVETPSGKEYTIRPVSSLFYLSGGGLQLHAVQQSIQEAIGARQKVKPKDKTKPTAQDELDDEAARKAEMRAIRRMNRFRTTMAPVLCEGLINPKVVDPDVLMRPAAGDEIAVKDFMGQFEEAFHVYIAIINLSTQKGGSSADGPDFPEREQGKAAGA